MVIRNIDFQEIITASHNPQIRYNQNIAKENERNVS